ncbi:hypothetical protein [Paenibacillus lutrae]|nr:hypothetical protein [Paenibacillus lutrae]
MLLWTGAAEDTRLILMQAGCPVDVKLYTREADCVNDAYASHGHAAMR